MFASAFQTLKGIIALLFFILNTVFWGMLIHLLIPFKLLAPSQSARRRITNVMVKMAEHWISLNTVVLGWLQTIEWDVQGLEGLRREGSYLITSNHQSWVDIAVLQRVFNRRIPFLRFFLKAELAYIPALGGAWWALDFPFMRRYSREYLAKHPEKRGEDFKAVRRACERFRGHPISVLNFLEGTRFTVKKHEIQKSTYRHLLKPKLGGVAFVLESMGDQFDCLLDVTIHYPQARAFLWDFLSGRMNKIVVRVRQLAIPQTLTQGGYMSDSASREQMREWIGQIWASKDQLIEEIIRFV